MVEQLGEAPASATTALRIECQSILGKLRHTFCVAPYTQTHLDGFDRIRANAVRRAYRLPKRFPTDAIFASHDNFGMGHPSATVEYVAAVLKHMFEALNDSGRLGTLARAMMHSVLHDRGHQPPPPPQPPEQAPPPPPADPPPESAGAPELQSSPDTQGYFADLFAEPDAQAQAPPPPPPPPPPPQPPSDRDLWDAPPLAAPCNQPRMLDRMYQWLLNWHFKARLDTTAGPQHTTPRDLWETLTAANRLHQRRISELVILGDMTAPLWQHGVRTLSDVMQPDGRRMQTPEQFAAAHPTAGQAALAALRRVTDLVCTLPGTPRAGQHGGVVPAHINPNRHPLPLAVGKLQHLQVVRCLDTRTAGATEEFLVQWGPSTAMSGALLEELQALGCAPASVAPSPLAPACFDVAWQPSWETTASMQLPAQPGHAVNAALFANMLSGTPLDTKAAVPPIPLPPEMLTIDLADVNPDVDVAPLPSPAVVVDAGKAWCYMQDGRCVAALPPSLLALSVCLLHP